MLHVVVFLHKLIRSVLDKSQREEVNGRGPLVCTSAFSQSGLYGLQFYNLPHIAILSGLSHHHRPPQYLDPHKNTIRSFYPYCLPKLLFFCQTAFLAGHRKPPHLLHHLWFQLSIIMDRSFQAFWSFKFKILAFWKQKFLFCVCHVCKISFSKSYMQYHFQNHICNIVFKIIKYHLIDKTKVTSVTP